MLTNHLCDFVKYSVALFSTDLISLKLQYKVVSSAYRINLNKELDCGKSLIYIRNNRAQVPNLEVPQFLIIVGAISPDHMLHIVFFIVEIKQCCVKVVLLSLIYHICLVSLLSKVSNANFQQPIDLYNQNTENHRVKHHSIRTKLQVLRIMLLLLYFYYY